MLKDVQFGGMDPGMALILGVICGGRSSGATRIGQGLYQINHFSFDLLLAGKIAEEYPEINGVDNCYGVCDSPEQFIVKCGGVLESDPRAFAVSFTEIKREEQSPDGGWRWHKWGPYIGEKEPTTEYLYDEKLIDRVFTFHIYQVRA